MEGLGLGFQEHSLWFRVLGCQVDSSNGGVSLHSLCSWIQEQPSCRARGLLSQVPRKELLWVMKEFLRSLCEAIVGELFCTISLGTRC